MNFPHQFYIKYKNAMAYDIRDYINYDSVENGHLHTLNVMKNALQGELLDSILEGSYKGKVSTAWKLEDNFYVIISSYFGSCSYCDRFSGHSKPKKELESLVHSARRFSSLEEMRTWIKEESQNEENYAYKLASKLNV